MISRIASLNNNKNGFLKYMLYRTRATKTHLIITVICGFLSFPLITLAFALSLHAEIAAREAGIPVYGFDAFVIISIFLCFVSAAVIGLLTYTGGVNCYDYFNRREKVDKILSLPITSRSRFWGDFVSGIAPIAIVYSISAAIGLLIINLGFPADTFKDQPWALSAIAAAMFAGLLTLISVYIIGVFCASICGRVYETVVYPALIFIIIPSIIGLFGTMIFFHTWQVYVGSQIFNALAGTSPGGFLACFVLEFSRMPGGRNLNLANHLTFMNPAVIIPFILINGGFLTGAYYLAKRRGAEKTGSAFVFKPALTILLSLVVFCITALFCLFIAEDRVTWELVFGMIACTAIAFLILDVSAKRGFKKMGTAFLKYAGMLVGSVIVSNLLLAANGFGIGNTVPAANNIQSVGISVNSFETVHIGTQALNYNFSTSQVIFTEAESIEIIRGLNVASNNNPDNNRDSHRMWWFGTGNWRNVQTLTYTLENGNTVNRNIILGNNEIEQALPLIMSDEYKATRLGIIDNWLRTTQGTVTSGVQVFTLFGDRSAQTSMAADVMKIYEAFKQDYLAETLEQRFYSTEKVLGQLKIQFAEHRMSNNSGHLYQAGTRAANLYVLPHYTNLIAELERQGLDVWNGAGEENLFLPSITIGFNDFIGINEATAAHNNNTEWYWLELEENERAIELTRQLTEVAQASYFINGAGYILQIHDSTHGMSRNFVIPPAYNELANELLAIARRALIARDPWYAERHDDSTVYVYEDSGTWVA